MPEAPGSATRISHSTRVRCCSCPFRFLLLLQSSGELAPNLEQQLRQQVGSLLRVALTVGECCSCRLNQP